MNATSATRSNGPTTSRPKETSTPRFSFAAGLIVFTAFCNFIGWALSAVHQLNAAGYAVAFAVGLAAFVFWWRRAGVDFSLVVPVLKLKKRFRRRLPAAFLLLGGLAILGGLLHPPANYDALAYRTPRVLHWLAEERWHWIHTDFNRLNTRGCGIEWVTAPIFALARTDRFIFLINAICFALIPGRVFGIWTRLGVRGRTAWHWMWLFPTGYCFLLQAGSIGNDLFGALLAMTAVEFALRARGSGRVGDLWVAFLAAGLMTAGKAFNLLLLLPWAIAVWPSARLLLQRPLMSVAALALAASVSLLPMAWLNYRHCGDWTGQKAEHLVVLGGADPALRVAVNVVLLTVNNFAPPIFPFRNAWTQLVEKAIPSALAARMQRNFEPGAASLDIGELQMEEGAGLGLGVSLLLAMVIVHRCWSWSWPRFSAAGFLRGVCRIEGLIPLSTCMVSVLFISQTGLDSPGRYFAPFYALLLVPVLAGEGCSRRLLCSAWWRFAGVAAFLMAVALVILSPPRPLWPAQSILRALGAEHSPHPLVRRAWTVYSVYSQRADAMQPMRALLPADANPLGFVTSDDPETSLWRPFGSRRIVHVCETDSPEAVRAQGVKYVVVSSSIVTQNHKISMEDWLARYDAEVMARLNLELRASLGSTEWVLVKLRAAQKP